mgnify:CR=1 FL=1
MKIKSLIFLLPCMAMVSCILSVDSVTPQYSAIMDEGYGGQCTFMVYASGQWTCSPSSNIEGMTVSPNTGQGDTEITLTIPENITGMTQVSYVNFSCGSARTPMTIYHEIPTMVLGDTEYLAVKMKDDNWWTASNIHYIEPGKEISARDFSTNTGIWYPCNPETGEADLSMNGIKTKGYFYSPEILNSICPEGWHLATFSEWKNLVDNYSCEELNKEWFNLATVGYVVNGESYSTEYPVTYYACGLKDGSETQDAAILSGDSSSLEMTMGSYNNGDGVSARCVKTINLL